MPYYHTCPTCGANLDPGEQCEDCREECRNEKLYIQQNQTETKGKEHFTRSTRKNIGGCAKQP